MSESEVLANEQADAKQAMFSALDDLKSDLLQAADLRLWAKQHPWATLGVAAVAGFAVAAALTPRRGETVGERMGTLADSLGAMAAGKEEIEAPTARASLGNTLLSKLFDLAKVALGNAIMLAWQSRMSQYSQPAAENGAPSADDLAGQAPGAS